MHLVEGSSAHAGPARPRAERSAARAAGSSTTSPAAPRAGSCSGSRCSTRWSSGSRGSRSRPSTRVLLVGAVARAGAGLFVLVIGFRGEERPGPLGLAGGGRSTPSASPSSSPRATLLVLGRIGPDDSLDVVAGRIAIELVPVTLGVSIANHLLPRGRRARHGRRRPRRRPRTSSPTLLDLFAAGAGALLLSLNIAPTDEVRMIASELGEPRLVAARALLAARELRRRVRGGARRPAAPAPDRGRAAEPADGDRRVVRHRAAGLRPASPGSWAGSRTTRRSARCWAQVVVLGLPGAVGAAAGRLAV